MAKEYLSNLYAGVSFPKSYHMDLVPEGVKRKQEQEDLRSLESPQKKPCCRVVAREHRPIGRWPLDVWPSTGVEEDSCVFPWSPEDATWVSEEEDRLMGMS